MLLLCIILILLSKSNTLIKEDSVIYSRTTIVILLYSSFIVYNNLHYSFLSTGIGVLGGLFHTTCITNVFHVFILFISSIILLLTSFFPRKPWLKEYSNLSRLLTSKLIYYESIILNRMSEQYRIIEYSLIILFVLSGALFLMCTSDMVSIFLSIELQSYGLYLLSAIYRDSEPATSGGLMYFLLGGLSSCFILLSTGLLYANSGTTNLESLYVITSISSVSKESMAGLLYWYKSYYIHISLLIMSVGFLFKVSAAPFHFWSPDVYDSIPTIVTTFVAIIAKISIFIFLLDLVHYTSKSILDVDFSWTMSLIFSSLLSLVIGTVVGLTQKRIKRLFAFSTISHLGFILLALCIHSIESTQAFIFYLMQYSISNLNAFFLLIAIGYSLYFYVLGVYRDENNKRSKIIYTNANTDKNGIRLHIHRKYAHDYYPEFDPDHSNYGKKVTRYEAWIVTSRHDKPREIIKVIEGEYNIELDYFEASLGKLSGNTNIEQYSNLQDINNSPIQLISQLKGYYYVNPMLALSLSITLFSFIGIPPLIGFFGKQMILSSALDSGYVFMSLVAILTSVISAVYYLFIIKEMFFDEPDYILNPQLKDFGLKGFIVKEDRIVEKVNINIPSIVISSSLSLPISILTLIIELFIFIPDEWLNMANILSLVLFNI